MTEPPVTLHVDESGPAEADSIVFLHGGNAAGSMWALQRESLPEFHQLVPDMPGFGQSHELGWSSIDDTVERLAVVIRERAHSGRAHLVGLSLGASVGFVLAARHPDLVRSALLSGTPIHGLGPVMHCLARLQLRLWQSVAYWTAIGRWFRLPPEALESFIENGVGLDPASAQTVVAEVTAGLGPRIAELTGSPVPILGLAGSRESRVVTHALPEFARADNATLRVAPGKHHLWSLEAPGLFTDTIRTWVVEQRADDQLGAVPRGVERHVRRVRRLAGAEGGSESDDGGSGSGAGDSRSGDAGRAAR